MSQAIDNLESARKIFERENDAKAVAIVTGELGIVYYYKNEFALALENYRRTTNACEAIKDSRGEMIGHLNIGDVFLQQRQYKAGNEIAHLPWYGPQKETTKMNSRGIYLTEHKLLQVV